MQDFPVHIKKKIRRFLERKQGNSTGLKQIQKSILEVGQKMGRLLEGAEYLKRHRQILGDRTDGSA
jgi:hypothetical protein